MPVSAEERQESQARQADGNAGASSFSNSLLRSKCFWNQLLEQTPVLMAFLATTSLAGGRRLSPHKHTRMQVH